MHAARLATSPRLLRALRALKEAGGPLSTMDLVKGASICAVNSVIAELRANGAEITCRQELDEKGRRRWLYELTRAPEGY